MPEYTVRMTSINQSGIPAQYAATTPIPASQAPSLVKLICNKVKAGFTVVPDIVLKDGQTFEVRGLMTSTVRLFKA